MKFLSRAAASLQFLNVLLKKCFISHYPLKCCEKHYFRGKSPFEMYFLLLYFYGIFFSNNNDPAIGSACGTDRLCADSADTDGYQHSTGLLCPESEGKAWPWSAQSSS